MIVGVVVSERNHWDIDEEACVGAGSIERDDVVVVPSEPETEHVTGWESGTVAVDNKSPTMDTGDAELLGLSVHSDGGVRWIAVGGHGVDGKRGWR